MSISVLALVLAAAVLHASWNLVLKASGDRLVSAAVQCAAGGVALLPLLVAAGYPTAQWEYLLGSTALHLGYGLTLVAGYERGDLSVVYPIARGTSPLLVAIGAAMLIDDIPSPLGVAGIVLVAIGILAVSRGRPSGVLWAVVCGVFIAGYTLVDGSAVRAAGESLPYTAALIINNTITLGAVALIRRGPTAARSAAVRSGGRDILGGLASAGAYLLVLTAARSAPLATVSAVRETSVIIGALAGWLLLGESFGRARVAAALAICAGVALIVV